MGIRKKNIIGVLYKNYKYFGDIELYYIIIKVCDIYHFHQIQAIKEYSDDIDLST